MCVYEPFQTEHLVDQQIVIDRLRGKKPHWVPPKMVGIAALLFSVCRCLCMLTHSVTTYINVCSHTLWCSWLCCACFCLNECICRVTPVPKPILWRGSWPPLRYVDTSSWPSLRKRMRWAVHSLNRQWAKTAFKRRRRRKRRKRRKTTLWHLGETCVYMVYVTLAAAPQLTSHKSYKHWILHLFKFWSSRNTATATLKGYAVSYIFKV